MSEVKLQMPDWRNVQLVTREICRRILEDPRALVDMAARDVQPEQIEAAVARIWAYLKATATR